MEQVADLLINGLDAYQNYGVRMGDGFISSLKTGAPLKDYVKNDSRLKHGVDYSSTAPKLNERNLTLQFTIEGENAADYDAKYDSLLAVLQAGSVTIQIPSRSATVYHLKYTGNGITYSENIEGTFSKFSAKFIEPDPTNRS